jgi:hypothetical protein
MDTILNKKSQTGQAVNSGFQKGAFYFSASTGSILSATGSLIENDKDYNDTLSTQSQLGIIDSNKINNTQLPPFVIPFSMRASKVQNGSLEYGISNNFGISLSLMQFSLTGTGQNRFPAYQNSGTNQNAVYTRSPKDQTFAYVPGRYTMYNGTNAIIALSYHFIPIFFLDPYLNIKLGGGGFTTSSHRGIFDDDKYFLRGNGFQGVSKLVGFGAGTNIYIMDGFGVKLEIEHYKQYLNSENFSLHTLNTTQILFGFVFNVAELRRIQ